MHEGKPWTGPDQFEDATGNLMMLPVDMMLIMEPAFKKYVEMYAKDEDKFFTVSIQLQCNAPAFIVSFGTTVSVLQNNVFGPTSSVGEPTKKNIPQKHSRSHANENKTYPF